MADSKTQNLVLTFIAGRDPGSVIARTREGKVCLVERGAPTPRIGEEWSCALARETERALIVRPLRKTEPRDRYAEAARNRLADFRTEPTAASNGEAWDDGIAVNVTWMRHGERRVCMATAIREEKVLAKRVLAEVPCTYAGREVRGVVVGNGMLDPRVIGVNGNPLPFSTKLDEKRRVTGPLGPLRVEDGDVLTWEGAPEKMSTRRATWHVLPSWSVLREWLPTDYTPVTAAWAPPRLMRWYTYPQTGTAWRDHWIAPEGTDGVMRRGIGAEVVDWKDAVVQKEPSGRVWIYGYTISGTFDRKLRTELRGIIPQDAPAGWYQWSTVKAQWLRFAEIERTATGIIDQKSGRERAIHRTVCVLRAETGELAQTACGETVIVAVDRNPPRENDPGIHVTLRFDGLGSGGNTTAELVEYLRWHHVDVREMPALFDLERPEIVRHEDKTEPWYSTRRRTVRWEDGSVLVYTHAYNISGSDEKLSGLTESWSFRRAADIRYTDPQGVLWVRRDEGSSEET